MTRERKLWKAYNAKNQEQSAEFNKFAAPFAMERDHKIMEANCEFDSAVEEKRKSLMTELKPFEQAWYDEYAKR